MTHCPICEEELSCWTDYEDHVLHESREECKSCKLYLNQYAHGHTEEHIGNIMIYQSYMDDTKQRQFNSMVRQMALTYNRSIYKEIEKK